MGLPADGPEDGEAHGAGPRAGTIAVVSSTAVDDLEAIAAASDGPKWWQLYLFAEPRLSAEMLRGSSLPATSDLLDRRLVAGPGTATRAAAS